MPEHQTKRAVDTSGKDLNCLNPSQRAAVEYEGAGPLLVLAGPGSGKTTVMIRRLRHLLTEKKILPEKLLAITFTREAAASMRERFLRECGDLPQQIIQSVNFGTFHSVFYQILKQSGKITEKNMLTEADKQKLMQSALSFVMPEISRQERCGYSGEMLAAVSYYKNTGDLKKAAVKAPSTLQEDFGRIYMRYERERALEKKLDYDDILLDCRELLAKNSAVLDYWRGRFQEILIDEFQDINPVQYEVIRLLSAAPYPIFAVGDDDQSVYGFRGAEPGCMRNFLEDYRAEKILLDVNYRSGQEIVKASLAVIDCNQKRFPKALTAGSERRGGVRVLGFQNKTEQDAYLIRICSQGGECAVLFRTNRLMQRFARSLQRAKVDYEMKEKSRNIYHDERVQDMMAYLRLGGGERKPELISRVINKPSRYVSREAMRIPMGKIPMDKDSVFSPDLLSHLTQYYRERSAGTAENIERMDRHLKQMKKMSPYLALQYVRRVIGYDGWILERYGNSPEEREESLEILDWLSEEAGGYKSLQDWLEDQKRYCDRIGQKPEKPCGIKLMTVHAAKGLEFEYVILPDCNERIYPYGNLLDADMTEEERRVFYVGMTRAKNRLDLLYLRGDKEHPMQMSRFLAPVRDYINSSNSALSRNSSNASLTFSYSSSSPIYSSTGSSLGSSGFSL